MGHRIMSTASGLNYMDEYMNRVTVGTFHDGCGAFYDPKARLFRLITKNTLYAFRITPRTNQIEHLYWGSRLDEKDDLSFLSLNSVLMKSPFDPTSQVVVDANRELAQLPRSPDRANIGEKWKVFTKEAKRASEGDHQRLENMSWRQWGLERLSPSSGSCGIETPAPVSPSLLSPRSSSFGPPTESYGVMQQQILGKNSLLLEYSDSGTGDYRSPSFRATARLSDITPVEYSSHRIFLGKPEDSDGVSPRVRCESVHDCASVVVTLRDRVTGLEVDLMYTVFPDLDVVVRRSELRNTHASADLIVDKAMASTNDFDGGSYTLTRLPGSWAREAQRFTHRVTPGILQISSSRGTSSHMHNPALILSKDTFGEFAETSGTHWGFLLVYSGSFLAEVENSETGRVRVNVGFNPLNFRWKLTPGESVSTPEVILAFSDAGVGQLSNRFHRVVNERIIAPQWRAVRPPVVVNTWEAMYFCVSRDKVVNLAKFAISIGAEILCLDDGWFRGRADDTTGLGDWLVDTAKIPLGLDSLCGELNGMGLKFGIWIEPEMVSPGSDLFEENPNGILFAPGRPRSMRRNQFILDFTQETVRTTILDKLRSLLKSCNIEYVKWDMNRHITEPNSVAMLSANRLQGEVMHRHMLGVYAVLDAITSEFPHVRFETCAGGGGRFDCGMLYYSPQIWASDNTDAVCRARIQAGLSLVYPVNTMACHITDSPNHQTGRHMPLSARSIVALFGAFGVELDLVNFSVAELGDLKTVVTKYKAIMDEMAKAKPKLFRLWDPFDSQNANVYGAEVFAWMLVSEDQSHAIVAAGMLRLIEVGKIIPKLQLRGIHPDKRYRVRDLLSSRTVRDATTLKVVDLPGDPVPRFKPLILPGRTLIHAGLPLQFLTDGDFVLLELSQTL